MALTPTSASATEGVEFVDPVLSLPESTLKEIFLNMHVMIMIISGIPITSIIGVSASKRSSGKGNFREQKRSTGSISYKKNSYTVVFGVNRINVPPNQRELLNPIKDFHDQLGSFVIIGYL